MSNMLKIIPRDFSMKSRDCPPGHFVYKENDKYYLCFKSEYLAELQYYNEAGEGMSSMVDDLEVWPIEMIEYER